MADVDQKEEEALPQLTLEQKQIVSLLALYTPTVIGFSLFLGGPLAGGYQIAENFKQMGNPKIAQQALWGSIAFTITLFSILVFLPKDILQKIPSVVIPIGYILFGRTFVKQKQETQIEFLIENGASKVPYTKIALVIISALVLQFSYVILLGLVIAK